MVYYAVVEGFNPGVYDNWPACAAEINGYNGAYYEEFYSAEEALDFLNQGGPVEYVFIDGACRGNGMYETPEAGYGVYYGPYSHRNAAVPLWTVDPDMRPTNQRAELLALTHALANIELDLRNNSAERPVRIFSDSQYVVKSFNEWSEIWRNNGWKNKLGFTVTNFDLFWNILVYKDLINQEYEARGWYDIEICYVRGHCGNLANYQADRLANRGADGEDFG